MIVLKKYKPKKQQFFLFFLMDFFFALEIIEKNFTFKEWESVM